MIADPVQQARIDLAAALRMAVRYGLHEGVCNHFSVMVAGDPPRFLINPYGTHWSRLRASDMLLVAVDGTVLEGDGEPETTAFCIHARIHVANPRATCVLHTHMPYATALTTVLETRLEPISQNALRFHDDVAYDERFNGLALDVAEGDRMAAALGDKRVLFLANHGVIVIGRTVAETFDDLYYLERAAQLQVLALSMGKPLRRIDEATARATFGNRTDRLHYAHAHFGALKRLLDHDEPDYAD
ncbi:MAG: aldolase [Rhodospirillaceae bacterium]|nr:aldolase [Rhodospirillaceae bacterium]